MLLAGPALASKELAQKHACLACHAADKKIVGPSYQEIAKKYAGQKDAEQMLAKSIKAGGSGKWGPVPMPAQAALNYIMAAQDPVGGGWRYQPKQPGDTSAVGWQLMALKSGHMAFLQVSPLTIRKAVEFLNSVQQDEGATYGYADPGNGAGTSAVGLLCRMYLGWKKDNPALQRGVARLAKIGPSSDLYYDYYATQILHHMEGEQWVAWNTKMRDMLVKSQSRREHEAGSWFEGFDKGHGPEYGGRLYCTALATMILEVYYRHLPLYSGQSVDEEFKE